MAKYSALSFALVGSVLFLTACAQPELPQDHYYRLEVPAPATGSVVLDGVLEVERFRADGLISGRPIAHRQAGGYLAEYHYHFWVEPPVDLLQDEMVKFLRGANIARHVVTPDLRMNEDYLLTGKIKRLERDMTNRERVGVEIEMGLKRVADDKILVLKTYARDLDQIDAGMNGAVKAINAALSDIYNQFLNDVR